MPNLFNPRLFNSPYGDPGLFVELLFNKRAILFDLGDIHSLPSRDVLKASHIFITHTHMDHFVGFDHLLRICLGRKKTLYLYGPEGFLANLEGKLNAYTWNLIDNYKYSLKIVATEVTQKVLISRQYRCQNKFQPTDHNDINIGEPLYLLNEPSLSIQATTLDHGIPTLGFSLKEKFKINIRKDALHTLGLSPGPWLQKFKQALYNNIDKNQIIKIPDKEEIFTLKELSDQLAVITKGQKITYISDVAYSVSNVEKIIEVANDTDHLFIESAFLEKDRLHAEKKYHLTARQAGEIAFLSGAKRFTLFHFSPRYTDQEAHFYKEAMAEYMKRADRK